MDRPGQMTTLPCVTFTRDLPAPPDRVWSFLTDTSLMPVWFGEDSSFEGREGGAVRLLGGHIRGVVTQWQPPHRLTYTWNVFDPGDPRQTVSPYPESYPTFELEPGGLGTILTFRHFPILERFIPQNAVGWHVMLAILADSIAGLIVADRGAYTASAAALYGVDLGALES